MDVNPIGAANSSLTMDISKYEMISYYYNVVIRLFFGSSAPTYLMSFFDINIKGVLNNENLKKHIIYNFDFSIIFINFFISFFFISIKSKKEKLIYLIFFTLFIEFSLIVVFGGVSDSLHGRYSSLPGIILIFSFLFLSSVSQTKWVRYFLYF